VLVIMPSCCAGEGGKHTRYIHAHSTRTATIMLGETGCIASTSEIYLLTTVVNKNLSPPPFKILQVMPYSFKSNGQGRKIKANSRHVLQAMRLMRGTGQKSWTVFITVIQVKDGDLVVLIITPTHPPPPKPHTHTCTHTRTRHENVSSTTLGA